LVLENVLLSHTSIARFGLVDEVKPDSCVISGRRIHRCLLRLRRLHRGRGRGLIHAIPQNQREP